MTHSIILTRRPGADIWETKEGHNFLCHSSFRDIAPDLLPFYCHSLTLNTSEIEPDGGHVHTGIVEHDYVMIDRDPSTYYLYWSTRVWVGLHHEDRLFYWWVSEAKR